MEVRCSVSRQVALFAFCAAGSSSRSRRVASATPGPGGWDNLGQGATPTASALNGAVYALTPARRACCTPGGAFTDAGGDATADYLAQWSRRSLEEGRLARR